MNDWCILRTKGSSTLRLARSLSDAGIEAWTPVEFQVRKSHGGGKTEITVAVMPTYVFAAGARLIDLLAEAECPASQHPDFSVFKHNERFPFVSDANLNGLRAVERKAAAENKPVVFPRDQSVRVPEGPFQALIGRVVEDTRGKSTLVLFPGCSIPIEFPSWQLERAA